jgi:hypothetical protein
VGVRCARRRPGRDHRLHLLASPSRRALGRFAARHARARGEGRWGAAFSALYRRTRARNERQRDLATTIDRFRNAVEALARRHGHPRCDEPHSVGKPPALSHLGIDLATDTGRPLANFMRAPEFIRYLETENFADAVVVESQRERERRCRSRSCRSASTSAFSSAATSRKSRRSRACAATSSPTFPRAQDAAHRHRRIPRDAAGREARGAAAHAIPQLMAEQANSMQRWSTIS